MSEKYVYCVWKRCKPIRIDSANVKYHRRLNVSIFSHSLILEIDPAKVSSRVMMRGAEAVPLAEQSVAQAMQSIRDQWLKGWVSTG